MRAKPPRKPRGALPSFWEKATENAPPGGGGAVRPQAVPPARPGAEKSEATRGEKKRQAAKNGLPEKILLDGEKIRPAFSVTVDRMLSQCRKSRRLKEDSPRVLPPQTFPSQLTLLGWRTQIGCCLRAKKFPTGQEPAGNFCHAPLQTTTLRRRFRLPSPLPCARRRARTATQAQRESRGEPPAGAAKARRAA